jgi:peroxiredoxin
VPPPTGRHFNGKVHFDLFAKLLADDRRSASSEGWLRELIDGGAKFWVKTQSHALLGRAAPDFTLNDHRGRPWSLKDRLERGTVVLVFSLGYSCTACVHGLFELNADLERFHRLGAEVVAISGDSPELTTCKFERYGAFGFAALSDPAHNVARAYGTYRSADGSQPEELLHGTFLIDRSGQVRWVHCGDAPLCNNKALLYELARLGGKESGTP